MCRKGFSFYFKERKDSVMSTLQNPTGRDLLNAASARRGGFGTVAVLTEGLWELKFESPRPRNSTVVVFGNVETPSA